MSVKKYCIYLPYRLDVNILDSIINNSITNDSITNDSINNFNTNDSINNFNINDLIIDDNQLYTCIKQYIVEDENLDNKLATIKRFIRYNQESELILLRHNNQIPIIIIARDGYKPYNILPVINDMDNMQCFIALTNNWIELNELNSSNNAETFTVDKDIDIIQNLYNTNKEQLKPLIEQALDKLFNQYLYNKTLKVNKIKNTNNIKETIKEVIKEVINEKIVNEKVASDKIIINQEIINKEIINKDIVTEEIFTEETIIKESVINKEKN